MVTYILGTLFWTWSTEPDFRRDLRRSSVGCNWFSRRAMADISRLKKSRSANKNVVSGLIVKAKEAITRNDVDDVAAKLAIIEAKMKLIEESDVKIQAEIDEDGIAQDVDDSVSFEETVMKDILAIKRFLVPVKVEVVKPVVEAEVTPKAEPVVGPERSAHGDVRAKLGVALPKIQIKEFTGDPATWQQFYDLFEATVDKHERLSEIEKFRILKGTLGVLLKSASRGSN